LDAQGALEGHAHIVFGGLEGLARRVRNHDRDETARRKALEDEVRGWLPSSASLELTNSPRWTASDDTLEAEFQIRIPEFASFTGQRLLFSPAAFQAREVYPFRTARRLHAIQFASAFQFRDTVIIELPPGFQVESFPPPRKKEVPSLHFEIARSSEGSSIRMTRLLTVDNYSFPATAYSPLRVFFDSVRAGDEEQIVLRSAETAPRP
jgi:hypothetical protein